eukprot:g61581.t1
MQVTRCTLATLIFASFTSAGSPAMNQIQKMAHHRVLANSDGYHLRETPQQACERISPSTGYHWCAATQECLPSYQTCETDQQACERTSASTGYYWCEATQECLPSYETCQTAQQVCESRSPSTGYHWCEPTQECVPSYQECQTAQQVCESRSPSIGYHWCEATQECLPSYETCQTAQQVCESRSPSIGYHWCESTQECITCGMLYSLTACNQQHRYHHAGCFIRHAPATNNRLARGTPQRFDVILLGAAFWQAITTTLESSACALAQAQATTGANQRRSVFHPTKHAQTLRSLVECFIRQMLATNSLTASGTAAQTDVKPIRHHCVGCFIREAPAISSVTACGTPQCFDANLAKFTPHSGKQP